MHSVLRGFVVLLACAAPIVAQGRAIQSPVGRGLAWVETLSGAGVEDPGGSFEAVQVPDGTIVTAFHELGKDWIAAGLRWTESGSELVLLRHREGATATIEPPARELNTFRKAPVLLIERRRGLGPDRLVGLAWLEGDGGENNSVMASRWTGSAFEPPQVVSPWPGEAQLALSGAVLDDGSILLLWAAVHAGNEDIRWSQSIPLGRGEWSPSERVHPENEVADVTPRVAAIDGGAIAVWSHFDGNDYRLRVARFSAGAWSDTGISSARGAAQPTLFPGRAGGVGILYQIEVPRSWALIELGSDGRLRRRAASDRVPGETRPIVWSNEAVQPGLRFTGRRMQDEAVSGSPVWNSIDWVELP